jgi:hypothetical protein
MRDKYQTRQGLLTGAMQLETVLQVLKNAPLDPMRPLEWIVREKAIKRNTTQNALMWSSALADIAEQVWIDSKKYTIKMWHEHCKREFLPDEFTEGITKEGYKKWDFMPSGERVLIGSTGDLTTGGFSSYLEQVYAFGASYGVMFRANANE